MTKMRITMSTLAATVLVTGCGSIREFHQRLHGESPTMVETAAISADQVVAQARSSVVKVHGEAEGCQTITEGSGFVVAPNKVMTNAHVVAGAETLSVGAGGNADDAAVISYDPQADIAILHVPGLSAPPLRFAGYTPGTGTQALVLCYPGATAFKASPAQIRETTELNGPDIYRATSVTRQVYILDGSFPESGASGSAVVDLDGQVLGVYFGAQTDDSTTGFAISAAQAVPQLAKARGAQPASTGACVG
jgi:S1-C subfamily serine protease